MIQAVFWGAWEQAYQLEQRYCRRMEENEAHDRPTVLRVANRPEPDAAGDPEKNEEGGDLWDNVADKVFDEMQSDEDAQFWKLPTAESMGAKASGDV